MGCTTILVGKNASYDGSTMVARNDDSGSGHFTPKKLQEMMIPFLDIICPKNLWWFIHRNSRGNINL